jgi:chromosome segregation protein
MLLKSIELSGFKSFAKKASFQFTSSISAIVGPNGSGKSNVAEAFRFVLGEQSIKSMRGKKGEDLIWNGGKDEPRSNRAAVKVVFDNSKKFLNIDYPEVAIERVVHRDGVNEYLINGSQVRLRDVVELLSSAHIGSSGHHIISQGEADRILNTNLKERREMIEDALGLKVYQYKRLESERKLEKTEENIKQIESLRKEIAPHLKFLTKQVEKIEKAKNMKEELMQLALFYLKKEDEYIKASEKEILEKKKPLIQKKEKLEKELREAKAVLEKSKSRDEKTEEVIDLEQKIQNTRKEKDLLLKDIGRLQGEIAAEERVIAREKIGSSMDGVVLSQKEIEDFKSGITKEIEVAKTSEDIVFVRTALEKISSLLLEFLKDKGKNASDRSKEAENGVIKLKSNLSLNEDKLSKLVHSERTLEETYGKIRQDIEKEKDTNRDAEKTLFRIVSEENTLIAELSVLKSEEERIHLVVTDFKRELEECSHLIGRQVLSYEKYEIEGDANKGEGREVQEERRRNMEKIKIRLEDSGLGGAEELMKEFSETKERDEFLERELVDMDKSAISLKGLIEELGTKLDIEFKIGIERINKEFQKYFEVMFGGGEASLKVKNQIVKKKKIDEDFIGDELESVEDLSAETSEEALADKEGIDIEVNLPRKKIKGLMMLSGGERALTSIALLFAMSQVNPPPFIILDETDAALDEANSKKYGDMIESLSKHSELILITHNRETMSRAGIIYGVTMGSGGASKVLSIQFEEAVVVAK